MLQKSTLSTRALFLKLFTQELIINAKKRSEQKKEITEKQEKDELKEIIKPIEPEKKPIHSVLSRVIRTPVEKPKELHELTMPIRTPLQRFVPPRAMPPRPVFLPPQQKIQQIQQPVIVPQAKKPFLNIFNKSKAPETPERIGIISNKLNIFLRDNSVTAIECPGPGKQIVIKRAGQINMTKINLSPQEISKIIEDFSEKARIPILGGIFRASVGNLTISAVISDFVGSKFIITKSSPYSLLNNSPQNPVNPYQ